MKDLYNKELKDAYLNSHENENTRTTKKFVFVKSARTEMSLRKDLYEFDLGEIKSVLYDMDASTKVSIRASGRFIQDYIDWAIKSGYKRNMNPLNGMLDEWYDQFVRGKKTLFSEKEVKYIEKGLVNEQDLVIVRCAFLGISMNELLNLKKENIDTSSRCLELCDGDRKRTMKVDKSTMDIIEKALNSEWYYSKNGKSIGKRTADKLVENDYVIKCCLGKAIYFERADASLIYRRLSPATKLRGYRYFSYMNIVKSGRLKWANDNYHRFGKINTEFLTAIAEHFDFEKIIYNRKIGYNIHAMKSYISEENLNELYPDIEEE